MRSIRLGEALGTTGSIKTGPFGTVLKASEYESKGQPVISVGEIGHGRLRIADKTPRVSASTLARLPEYVLRAGDIVFARKGAVDRSALVQPHEDGYFLGSDGIRLRTPDNIDSTFVSYQFQSPRMREWLVRHASGSTMPSLNQTILEQTPLMLPPLSTQRAIAEVLGALDDKIAANDRLGVAADQYLEAEFSRVAASAASTTLAVIAGVDTRGVKPMADGELRYLDIASVGVGRYDFPALMSWSAAPGRARRSLQLGDTVWSTVRPNRRSHALILDREPLIGSTGLAVLRSSRGQFATLYEATRRPEFVAFLESAAEGSAYPAVRAARFLDAPVPDLTDEASRGFEELAAPIRERVHSGMIENRTLAALRDTLLPALMSGRLSVKDAENTVSEVV